MTRLALLGQVPFLAPLAEEQLRELAQACRVRKFKRGDVLFYEEDPGEALFILLSGQVKILRLAPDGEERILHTHGPGEHFGELALVDGAPRSAKAVALSPVEALTLHRADLLSLVQGSPAVALAVMTGLSGMVRRLSEQVQDLTALDVTGRLAKKLLELADQHGQVTPDGIRVAIPLTQQELADMIGATRVAVNYAFSWYRSHGIVTADREGITLHQPEQLKQRIY